MDYLELASRALSQLIGPDSQQYPDGDSTAENIQQLRQLIETLFQATPHGQALLAALQEEPQNENRQEMARHALAEALGKEPTQAEQMTSLLSEDEEPADASTQQHSPSSSTVTGSSISKSAIAGRDVDQSRRTRVVIGGGLALLILASIIAYGVITAGNDPDATTQPAITEASQVPNIEEESVPPDLSAIGTTPGAAGAREVANSFLQAIANQDSYTACQLMVVDIFPCDRYLPGMLQQAGPSTLSVWASTQATGTKDVSEYGIYEASYSEFENVPCTARSTTCIVKLSSSQEEGWLGVIWQRGRWLISNEEDNIPGGGFS
jgi:hypothetical protein